MAPDQFTVKESPELGRYAVASRDLKAGEIFLEEEPFAFGPKSDMDICCLECYIPTEARCAKCGWPMCSDCTPKAHSEECNLFSSKNIKFYGQLNEHGACSQLDCVTPLRVLLAMDRNRERFDREVAVMEYHDEERRKSKFFEMDQNNVVNYLRQHMKLEYPEELIQKVLGILEVNAFEGRSLAGYPLRILYPKLAILAHSCVTNTDHVVFPSEDYVLRARVTVDVKEGADLLTSYTYLTYGTTARQLHLREGKFFTCHCPRCVDPSELGTHNSSLKCGKCDNGVVMSSDPLDINAEWKCTHCKFTATGASIVVAVAKIQEKLDEILAMDFTKERLEALEAFFKSHRSVFHPSHYIMVNVRQNLIQLYGRVEEYGLSELPDLILERMIELCQGILKVLNVVEPGLSRSRGLVLFEMHIPMITLAQSHFMAGVIDNEQLKEKLKEVLTVLQECEKIFSFEDLNTPEGGVALTIAQALDQLEASIQTL